MWYIRSKIPGEGKYLGLAFFEGDRGIDCSPDEKPAPFPSKRLAEEFLEQFSDKNNHEVVEEE